MIKKICIILPLFFVISAYAENSPISKYAFIIGDKVNLRESASKQSKKLEILNDNELIEFIEESKDYENIEQEKYKWIKIKRNNNSIGWVFGKYVLKYDAKPCELYFYIEKLNKQNGIKLISKNNSYYARKKISEDTVEEYSLYDLGYGYLEFIKIIYGVDGGVDKFIYLYRSNGNNLDHVLTTGIDITIMFQNKYLIISDGFVYKKREITVLDSGITDPINNNIFQYSLYKVTYHKKAEYDSGEYFNFEDNLELLMKSEKTKMEKTLYFRSGKFTEN